MKNRHDNKSKREVFKNQIKGKIKLFLLFFLLTGFLNKIISQTLPLNDGDRILWIGNSFLAFYGPTGDDVKALLKVSNPSINIYCGLVGKGMGILKEYATWNRLHVIDSIRKGGWKYVIIQTWGDAYSLSVGNTLEDGSPDTNTNLGYPACQDTLVKYFKVLDAEIKKVGARTIYYQPHLNGGDLIRDYSRATECMNKAKAEVPDAFYANIMDAWENVRADFPQSSYGCPGSNLPKGGIMDFMYSDCVHQSSTGIKLDAFTFYTIFTGKSGENLNPTWASYADNYGPYRPEFQKYLARTGYYVGAQLTGITPIEYSDTEVPSTPINLTATTIAPNYITIQWDTCTDNYVVNRYLIYKDGILIDSVYLTSYTISNLTASSNYSISVKAKDVDGNLSDAAVLNIATLTEYENLALNKPATSSSNSGWGPPSNAVDGNTDGPDNDIFASVSEANPWWQVDLGSIDTIGDIEVWNYTACAACYQFMEKYYVFVSDSPFTSNDPETLKTQTDVWYIYHSDYPNPVTTTPVNRTGRYVRVQLAGSNYLAIAEVRVFKSPGLGADVMAPSAPTNTSVSNITQTGFTLSWTASTDNVGVVSYEVFAGPTSKGTTTSTSMSVTGLTCYTQYAVDVSAKDAAGNISVHSYPLGVTTLACATDFSINSVEPFSVYPNITNGLVTVNLYSDKDCVITLFDLEGRILLQQKTTNEKKIIINLGSMAEGMYIIKVDDGVNITSKKLIKE